jgi:hypothetical protein
MTSGASAVRMATVTDTMTTAAKTVPSIAIDPARGMSAGMRDTSTGSTERARPRPASEPSTPSTACSTSNCERSRVRVAPSAVRTAISRARPTDRPRIRVPRLVAASIRMSPTAPSRISSVGRVLPTVVSCSGASRSVRPQVSS